MFSKSIAQRENVKLKIGLAGPSGSGKTLSALLLAKGITGDWSKIAVADTENRSALYYAGSKTGPWTHIPFDPDADRDGYHPSNWVKLIRYVEDECPEVDVLILDSISHEWEGKGGCLEINTKLGGRYQDWAKVTPLHARFIDAIRLSRLHIIATMRSKQDYAMEQNDKGKVEVKKVGLKSIQREGADYEFGILFDVDINHLARANKDRTGIFDGRLPFVITPDHGQELMKWASSGIEIYRETAEQKKKFGDLCRAQGLSAQDEMQEVSRVCRELEMGQLVAAIKEWKAERDAAAAKVSKI